MTGPGRQFLVPGLTDTYPLGIFQEMKLPNTIREQFRAYGRDGGRARARRMSPAERRRVAREAVLRRWMRARFRASSFEELGLPGGEMVDAGLAALAAGKETVESLVVSLAAPRLRREGVPLPRETIADADARLYRMLERASGDMAHARYLAYLNQAASFADACRLVLVDRGR